MKNLILTSAIAALGTGLVLAWEHQRTHPSARATPEKPAVDAQPIAVSGKRVHAAGRVEGKEEPLLIRPEFAGLVRELYVVRGARVSGGTKLFVLDRQRYAAQRDLAVAALAAAEADKRVLIAGARASEIEAARQEMLAAQARLGRAQRSYERAQKLAERRAVSVQELEHALGEYESFRAMLLASQQRYETIKAPPRVEDLTRADAAIASARASLQIAEVDLAKCTVTAPTSGVILDVNIGVGEWISPQTGEPAIEMADTSELRIVADVDEHDALFVQLGQTCEITSDAMESRRLSGVVIEIEPRMEPKKIYGGWAGERNESHARRVWIRLESSLTLPIGLPVEVEIIPSRER
ncbi:MAG: efflux RND transporter periplasmic adaptor subunit [Planctomycetota bacterium]